MSERLTMGVGSYSATPIKLVGKKGTVKIGKYCSIAGNVKAILVGHNVGWITTYPFPVLWPALAGEISGHPTVGHVEIGNDVWVGEGVTFLAGTRVGDGAVIGAGSVVAGRVTSYSIVVGNPARLVAMRFPAHKAYELLKIAWWDWPEEKIAENVHLLCSHDMSGFIEKHRKR